MSYHGGYIPVEENIIRHGSKHFISGSVPMRVYQESEEELRKMQNRLAGEIYFQRCLEFGR